MGYIGVKTFSNLLLTSLDIQTSQEFIENTQLISPINDKAHATNSLITSTNTNNPHRFVFPWTNKLADYSNQTHQPPQPHISLSPP